MTCPRPARSATPLPTLLRDHCSSVACFPTHPSLAQTCLRCRAADALDTEVNHSERLAQELALLIDYLDANAYHIGIPRSALLALGTHAWRRIDDDPE